MDQETHESKRTGDDLSQGNETTRMNSSNSVNGVALDSVVVTNSAEGSSNSIEYWGSRSKVDAKVPETAFVTNSEENEDYNGERRGFGSKIDEMGSSGAELNAFDTCDRQEIGERMGQNGPGSSANSSNLVDVVVLETIVVVNSDQTACLSRENRDLEVKSNELASSKALVENLNRKVSKTDKESCVIDVKCDGEDGKELESPDGERVCRICHLSSVQSSETAATSNTSSATTGDLIHLGCGCKDELGIAHSHCAETWFKLKGNRLCEICGQTAKNVTGVMDCRFMEEWNERRFMGGSSSSERGGCLRGRPFCNFLMACLVIAFVLPWFFRVNMF